jgi:ribosomal protein S18 acetylase RimI-like enzyme
MIPRRWRRPRLRRLAGPDAADWRALRQEALDHHPEALGDSHDAWSGLTLEAYAEKLERGCVFGAFDGGALVGCVALDLTGAARGEVTGVYVRESHRRRGIARRLLACAMAEARRRGLSRLSLQVAEESRAARGLYAALGFAAEVDRPPRVLSRDGRLHDLVEMSRAP